MVTIDIYSTEEVLRMAKMSSIGIFTRARIDEDRQGPFSEPAMAKATVEEWITKAGLSLAGIDSSFQENIRRGTLLYIVYRYAQLSNAQTPWQKDGCQVIPTKFLTSLVQGISFEFGKISSSLANQAINHIENKKNPLAGSRRRSWTLDPGFISEDYTSPDAEV